MAQPMSARKKIVKEKGQEPDEFEESVAQVCVRAVLVCVKACGVWESWTGRACRLRSCVRTGMGQHARAMHQQQPTHSPHTHIQALFDLEATNTELKGDLRDLYITSAREIDIHNTTRKAIIVHVSV